MKLGDERIRTSIYVEMQRAVECKDGKLRWSTVRLVHKEVADGFPRSAAEALAEAMHEIDEEDGE